MSRRPVACVYLLLLLVVLGIALYPLLTAGRPVVEIALALGLLLGVGLYAVLRRVSPPELAPRRARTALWLIVAGSVLLRVLWLALVPTDPVSDFQLYHQLGVELAERGTFSRESMRVAYFNPHAEPPGPTAYLMPGYPLLLSLGYRLFGPEFWWGYLLNLLSIVAMQIALFHTLRRLADTFRALAVAAAIGLHPTLLFSTSLLGLDLVGTAALAISASLLLAAALHPSARGILPAAGCGLLLGLAIHCRPYLVLLIPVYLVALIAWHRSKPSASLLLAGKLAVLLLAVAATLVPWVVRNQITLGAPVFATTANAITVYLNNGPGTQYPTDPHDPVFAFDNDADRIAYSQQQARRWILQHPGEFAQRGLRRVAETFRADGVELRWTGVRGEEGAETDLLGEPPRSWALRLTTVWWGMLLGALLAGLAGMCSPVRTGSGERRLAWQWAGLGLAVLVATLAAVFIAVGGPRYHMVWVPFAYATLALTLALRPGHSDPADEITAEAAASQSTRDRR